MTGHTASREAGSHVVDRTNAYIPDGSEPCIDHPGLWFPDPVRRVEYHRKIDRSIAICNTCPRQFECLQKARRRGERNGVWGGVNFDPTERRGFAPACPDCGKRSRQLETHRNQAHRTTGTD
jgi:hypothetical protein